MSVFSKQDYELINLAVCIKNQADRLDVEHEGVPLEGVVVRIAEAAIAARREAVRLMTAEPRAGVVAEEPEWEYGIISPPMGVGWVGSREYVDRTIARFAERGAPFRADEHIVRRVKQGEWVPVKQEGGET